MILKKKKRHSRMEGEYFSSLSFLLYFDCYACDKTIRWIVFCLEMEERTNLLFDNFHQTSASFYTGPCNVRCDQ